MASACDTALDRFAELPAADRAKLNRAQRVDWFAAEVRKTFPQASRSRLEATFAALDKARGGIAATRRER